MKLSIICHSRPVKCGGNPAIKLNFHCLMKKSEITLTTIHFPLDFLMLILAGLAAYSLRFAKFFTAIKPVIFKLTFENYFSLMLAVAAGWMVLFVFSGLYNVKPNRRLLNELSRVIFACSTGLAAVTIYIFFRRDLFDSRFIVLVGWFLAIIFVSAERLIMRLVKNILYRLGVGVRCVILIGAGHVSNLLRETIIHRRGFGYRLSAQFEKFDQTAQQEIEKLIKEKKADEILLTNPKADQSEALALIDFCETRHLTFKYSADLFSTYVTNMALAVMAGIPIVEIQKTRLQAWGRVIKRLMDFIGSLILIIITSPLMFFSALAILIETGRPIIYKNERIGEAGKKFSTLKFRSMYQKYCISPQFDNNQKALEFEKELIKKQSIKEGPIYKIKNDPRVTKVGTFIRRLSLDELPQFFNILTGQMSLVGPRPHQPREVAQYEKHHFRVLNIKPGLTGLAQISGRSDLEFEEEVRLDTFYLEHWSALTDIIILIKTPFVLLKPRKAL